MAIKNVDSKDPFENLPSVQLNSKEDPFEHLPSTPQQAPQYSELESGGLGALQGASLGFADEAEGAVRAGYDKLVGDSGDKDLAALYQQYRDLSRKRYEQAQEANPKSFLGGQLAGGLTTLVVPGLGGASLAGAAGLGAAAGFGSSKADLVEGDIGGAVKDTAIGGTIGLAGGLVGRGLAKALTPKARLDAAAGQAAKALGTTADTEGRAIGKAVLEEGALPLTGGSKPTQEAIQTALDANEQELQPLLKKATDALKANPESERLAQTDLVQTRFNTELDNQLNKLTTTQSQKNLAENIRKDLIPLQDKIKLAEGNPLELNQIKQDLYQVIKALKPSAYTSEDSGTKVEIYKALAHQIKNGIEDFATAAEPGLGAEIKAVNDVSSKLINGRKLATKLVEKDLDNPPGQFKLKDLAGPGFASMIASPLTGLKVAAGVGAKVGLEKATNQPIGRFANTALAKTNYAVSKGLEGVTGEAIQAAVPAATKAVSSTGVQHFVGNLYDAEPDALKQISSSLMQNDSTKHLGLALDQSLERKDPTAKNAAIFSIMQNPNSRMLLKEDEED